MVREHDHLRDGFRSVEDYDAAEYQLEYYLNGERKIQRAQDYQTMVAKQLVLLYNKDIQSVTVIKRQFKPQ